MRLFDKEQQTAKLLKRLNIVLQEERALLKELNADKTKENYRRFLQTKTWQVIRQLAGVHHHTRCAVYRCPKLGSQLHHLRYRQWGGEDFRKDFAFLCGEHHKEAHEKLW